MKKPFYSIGIIFKNEIRCLERCLKSLQPLRDAVPCEVVMADTGSDDGSREVAEQYADILFDFPWINDFSAARNAVMDRCSGQWYISVDADEWLVEGVGELKEFWQTKKVPLDFAGFHIRNFQAVGKVVTDNYVDFVAVRLARLSTGVRYEGCIHEGWTDPKHETMQVMTLNDTWFYHDGYAYVDEAAQTAKRERNAALLRRKLADNPQSLQILMECVDNVKRSDRDAAVDYVKRAIDGVQKKWHAWDRLGRVAYRNAVSVATLYSLPELPEWAEQAKELFPESIYTQVDVSYYAFAYYWGKNEFAQARDWGEKYLKGIERYKAGKFENSESMWGVMENIAPLWERKVRVLMPEAYIRCGEPEKAFSAFQNVKGQELEDEKQVELCTLLLIRLHRTTMMDAAELMRSFWDQIGRPEPDEGIAKRRRQILTDTAASAFTKKYWEEEAGREDFIRHGCGIFAKLEGECELGIAARMLETEDAAALEAMLGKAEELEKLPGHALAHALGCGARFPLGNRPLTIEQMDMLAGGIARDKDELYGLAQQAGKGKLPDNAQGLGWARGLCMAALKVCPWKEIDGEIGLSLSRAFTRVERAYLPVCYAPEALNRENLFLLPPLHRFGWYCVQAFDALDAGDTAGYVRLLREGLAAYEGVKDMVEFLIDHTPELRTPSDELNALAEQIRAVLANFASGDPAVAALKQSEAYQKVAYLIEGMEPYIVGGQTQ